MTRFKMRRGTNEGTKRIVQVAVAVGAGILAINLLPSIKRYLHIRRMAGDGLKGNGSPADAPASAQAPRWGTHRWPTG